VNVVSFEKNLRIAGLQKNSTVDFPGLLSAVVFFAGCNFRCYYCHNSAILDSAADGLPLLRVGEVMDFLDRRRGLLDGVVISGGEATLQQGLYAFAKNVKAMGYKVKLDTNGSRPETVASLLDGGLLDFVAVDYKAPFRMYGEVGGGPAAHEAAGRVLETFGLLRDAGVPYEIRVTMIPEITEKALAEMAESLPRLERFALQLYRPTGDDGRLRPVGDEEAGRGQPYTPTDLERLAKGIRYAQPNVTVR
jgi:pyruvate formate lyase activating enzyme